MEAARSASADEPLEAILDRVATRKDIDQPTPTLRRRIAGLLVGELAEQEFERRYRSIMRGQEFDFEDERSAANETDFLVFDGRGRRAFRINIKAHGTFFKESHRFVGLEPEDTFALATYKIKDANHRSASEALPFLFAVVSSSDLATGPISESYSVVTSTLLDTLTLYKNIKGARALEDAVVQRLVLAASGQEATLVAGIQHAVASASWRVMSAVKADHLMNELMWERVPAVAQRNFSGNRESQPNMHFSLGDDMVGLDDFLELLRDHGLQHVATKIAYHQI